MKDKIKTTLNQRIEYADKIMECTSQSDVIQLLEDYEQLTKEQPMDDDEFYIDCSALTILEQAQLRMFFSTGKIKITPIHKQPSVDWEEKFIDWYNNFFNENGYHLKDEKIVESIKQMKGMK